MKMNFVLALCFIPATLLAINFFDDFESFSPGEDIDSSPYWLRPGFGANLFVQDEGGNNIVETSWGADSFATYICLGSAVWRDGSVSSDVKFNGSEAVFGLLTRLTGSNSECYMAGIAPAIPPLGATVIAYVDPTGQYTILSQDFFYPMSEDTWYDLSFEVTGINPVELSLSIDGTVNSTVTDDIFNLDMGMAGVVCGFDGTEPMFYMDNFEVIDNNMSLTSTTFAGIKAFFQRL